jgi:hypothetical protein
MHSLRIQRQKTKVSISTSRCVGVRAHQDLSPGKYNQWQSRFQRHIPTTCRCVSSSLPSNAIHDLIHPYMQWTNCLSAVWVTQDVCIILVLQLLAPSDDTHGDIDGRQVLRYSYENFVYERSTIDMPKSYAPLLYFDPRRRLPYLYS